MDVHYEQTSTSNVYDFCSVVTKVEDELGKASLISFDPIYTPETKRSPTSPVDVSLLLFE